MDWEAKARDLAKRNVDLAIHCAKLENEINALRHKKPEKPQANGSPSTTEQRNFEKARLAYPGTKRGFRVEFENFCAKHKDWKSLLDDDGLYECIMIMVRRQDYRGGFWPHFQTFLNQSRYEEALQPIQQKASHG